MIDPTLAALWAVDALPLELGIALLAAHGGQAETRVTVEPRHANTLGICHGGMIFTLADTCFGFAAQSLGAERVVTQAASINFLSPGQIGEVLTARGAMVSRSGRTGIFDVTVTGGDGRIVALLRGQARFLAPANPA